ncbi:TPA: ead/Ea22-like family protein [Klebsiella pneumoniae]|uniref:ead/Ea22-like family protein n=1 Tax=Klebsiella pneumoniae TaxID=573 RepID=UPI0027EE7AC5|nr:ead/Ea22-like family protein [Klebsiella pneumoniae]HEL9747242.1 ead/Ea22-like family protein [Klebsiella pneumoniae]HEL9843457.1 ead/Ea22-like family protein [Klebsiella pneumoniae]HEL9936538.1 ead/Ea22-like family protein [Klebsiella pneumoniae]HEL9941982.1 ead/Ea22-like family protein [Klebsiella pneumoniae]
MTDITELAQREKFEAWFVNDVAGADVTFPAFEDGAYAEGEIYDEQLYFMLQAMWMAWKAAGAELVEALEKAQRYIEELRDWNAGLAQESCERQQLISELEPIRAAAEKLVRCKGRYHSEQNYRALAALFGVNTPDLPPLEHENVHYADAAEMEIAALRQRIAELESQLKAAENNEIDARCHIAELESRTVTVKLPQRHSMLLREDFNEDYHTKMAYKADEVNASLAAAGIKVEAE